MDQLQVALEGAGINQPYSGDAEQAVLGAAIIYPEIQAKITVTVEE